MRRPSLHAAHKTLRLLRQTRVASTRDLSIQAPLERLVREVAAVHRQGDAAVDAWERVAPAPLRARATVVSLSRGTLTLRTSDAAARFEADRWLRSGGQATLARAAGRAITRIRFAP